jgi:hypothetical protein
MITIAIVVAALITSLAVGLIALIQIGVAREESHQTLLTGPTSRSAAATRRVVGLYVRTPKHNPEDDSLSDQYAAWLAQRPPRRPGR